MSCRAAAIAIAIVLGVTSVAAAVDTGRAHQMLARSGRLRYNRVEGLFLGYRLGFAPPAVRGLDLHVQTGYGFDSQQVRWEAGLAYESEKALLGLTVFDRTGSNDEKIVGAGENTVFAALFKWDYRDYFRERNGFELTGRYRIRPRLDLITRLSAFAYESMPVQTDWSLFYHDRSFRPNPAVREGDVGLLRLGLAYDGRSGGPLFRNAWVASAVYRRAFREFDHNALDLAVTRFQKTVFGNQAVVVTGRIGTTESTAEQFLYDLGGVGTLRGYEIKEYTGNRVVFLSAEYLFRGDIMRRVPVRGFDLLSLILFCDTGWLSARPRSDGLLDGFGGLSLKDFKTDVGASVALMRQIFRFDVARRLDRREDTWVLSARIRYKL